MIERFKIVQGIYDKEEPFENLFEVRTDLVTRDHKQNISTKIGLEKAYVLQKGGLQLE